jgi:hypothetical protein
MTLDKGWHLGNYAQVLLQIFTNRNGTIKEDRFLEVIEGT